VNKYFVGDAVQGKGTLKDIVILEEDIPKKFRMADSMDATTFEILWAMVRRHGNEAAIRKEALWTEVAALVGYKNLGAAHEAGLSFEIDYDNNHLLVFESNRSASAKAAK